MSLPFIPHLSSSCPLELTYPHSYGGKLQRIERQIHHYGSGLNALVLLSAFRSDPSDTYLLQVGYGGTSGPLSNINAAGFASASFHSFPDTLKWDGYSGDYGPGFLGLVLGSGTYVAQHETFGLLAYGGLLSTENGGKVTVQTNGPVTRRFFIGPLGLTVTIDAGSVRSFTYDGSSGAVSVTLTQSAGPAKAAAAVLWVETNDESVTYSVSSSNAKSERLGWRIPLTGSGDVVIGLSQN